MCFDSFAGIYFVVKCRHFFHSVAPWLLRMLLSLFHTPLKTLSDDVASNSLEPFKKYDQEFSRISSNPCNFHEFLRGLEKTGNGVATPL